jgi:cytoskeletal protein CcmA (bactofilin family)
MFKKPETDTQRIDHMPAVEREPQPARVAAAIGPTIRIKGDISGEESLTVEGTVEGTITIKQHTLHVGKNGRINADIYAKAIRIEGHVEGNLHAEEQVLLRNSGVVRGNISSPRLTMEDGCSFKGSVDMDPRNERKSGGERTGAPNGEPAPAMAPERMANVSAARAR